MSFEAPPIATVAPHGITPALSAAAARVAPSEPSDSPGAVKLDTIPASPPPEVTQAIVVAADAYDRLATKGAQLSFHVDERTGRLQVDVHDLRGNVLFSVPPSKALDIASGGDLDH